VGPHDFRVKVAHQMMEITPDTSSINSRCFINHYGRFGEYCLKCWEYVDAQGRILSAAKCSGRYTAPIRRNGNTTANASHLDFFQRGGSEEPVPLPGFYMFPPPECQNGGCIPEPFSGASDIPESCKPKINKDTGKWEHENLCQEAVNVGELCHPDRFDGYCYNDAKGDQILCNKDNSEQRVRLIYDFHNLRKGCPSLMPCIPSSACGLNNTCTEGYVSYYKPFSSTKYNYPSDTDGFKGVNAENVHTTIPACKFGHYTLPDGRCFAPRCSQCNPMTHFRLDGLCTPCPTYPWLIPLLIVSASLIAGVGTVALSRSGVSFVILNITIDYMQVLSLFAGPEYHGLQLC
jgi:hypothetical protein